MKVVFGCTRDESSVYEFPDDTPLEELQDAADEWVRDNIAGFFEIIEDEE